jgi:hypothetical protein
MRGSVERRHIDRLVLVLGLTVAVAVAGCGSSAPHHASTLSSANGVAAHLPPVPQLTPGDRAAIAYLNTAYAVGLDAHPKACRVHLRPMGTLHTTLAHGSPSRALLSSFAVLEHGAKTGLPADGMPLPQAVFANYVRLAQRRFGWPFKVFAVKDMYGTSHCRIASATAAMRASAAHAPAGLRGAVRKLEPELLLDEQYSERHPNGICVSGYHGGSFCEPFLIAVSRGGLIPIAVHYRNPVTSDLVPNGVARITARYPPQHGSPSRTVTVTVKNNLAVWKITGEPGDSVPTIQWLAANGRIIRTVNGPS